jgi:hypothetical protein
VEAIAFVVALAALAALAHRFGQDSRACIRSKEQEFASYGMTWADLAQELGTPRPSATAAPVPREVPVAAQQYPTLALIERALGGSSRALAAASDADRLEARARELVAEYWSDAAWTIGLVPEAAFRRVLAELAPALLDAPGMTVERPAAVAEPLVLTRATPATEPRASAPARERDASRDLTGSMATA